MPLKPLIWKDMRCCRSILVVSVVLLIIPYLTCALLFDEIQTASSLSGLVTLAILFEVSSYFSLILSEISLAILAASLIACERADRSAEFLAYLPPSPIQVILAKSVLLGTVGLIVWLPNLLVLQLTSGLVPNELSLTKGLPPIWSIAAVGSVSCGGGWLASATVRTPAEASIISLSTPIILVFVLYIQLIIFCWPNPQAFGFWYGAICFAIAPACYFLGCWRFVHKTDHL